MGGDELAARFLELEEVRRANILYGRDALADRLAGDLRSAFTQLVLDDRRVSAER